MLFMLLMLHKQWTATLLSKRYIVVLCIDLSVFMQCAYYRVLPKPDQLCLIASIFKMPVLLKSVCTTFWYTLMPIYPERLCKLYFVKFRTLWCRLVSGKCSLFLLKIPSELKMYEHKIYILFIFLKTFCTSGTVLQHAFEMVFLFADVSVNEDLQDLLLCLDCCLFQFVNLQNFGIVRWFDQLLKQVNRI